MDIERILRKYPINARETIFKEIMHYEILESLFSINDIANTLVFQGGTALRLCYYINRYSEDLDFVINKGAEFSKEFMRDFENIFCEKISNKYNLETEIIEPKENKNIVQRWSARIYLPNHSKKSKINLEIVNIPSHDNRNVYLIPNYEEVINKSISLYAESTKEIFADKLLALALRDYMKFRDFWDIEWLQRKTKPDYDLLRLKIKDYKQTEESFLEKLKNKEFEIRNNDLEEGFLREMSRFLEPNEFLKVKERHFYRTLQERILEAIDDIKHHFNESEDEGESRDKRLMQSHTRRRR
ncbi:hypothetical protein BKN38_06410 [Helicobacter sp. CLO-3]|uniref:nucleotidyl transferase AbiEii/AbiGii toxin family protein n=1 Tax=unclassified Helicobacter TaxID=2593540 RepID=UPI000804AA93|nr:MULTISPECIES: nucleotidyl transferase AbiEii/AbiGii toxin family protein [unclassified Helicobacter]OBV29720.1 hypothetical protein BA723_04285 [Helicobacter sp. CLO-3]OHU82834.1 hypothetical protein BKN38_06410 [Helicobacter sp. CLO-3]